MSHFHGSRSAVSHTPSHAMDYLKQIKLFTTFSQFFDSNRNDPVKIENAIFLLHSKWTVMILMVGTMFLSMRQYFGEPIECLSRTELPASLLQQYCWLEGSFSVIDSSGKSVVGDNIAYPGVKTLNEASGERKQSHKYYQWVYFVLIIQAIMFYTPKYLWKAKEAKRLKTIIYVLIQRNINEWNEIERRKITQDVFDSILISSDYFFFFFFCEFLYFLHLILQIWFVQIFLSGQFLRLGVDWLVYSHNTNLHDPLIRVFPRMTKCNFHKFGYSGSIETHDALCFLTLNIVNEKIYIVLWFWFAFLFVITSLGLVNRIALVLFPKYRYFKITKLAPSTDRKYLKHLTSRVGNWFILYQLCIHMKPSYFRDLMNVLVKDHFDKDYNLIIGNNNLAKSSTTSNNSKNKLNNLSLMGGMQMNLNNNKVMMAPNGQMVSLPSAPMQSNAGGVSSVNKKKSNKSNMKNPTPMFYVRGNNAANKAGFVSVVNRDPPSGHSNSSDEGANNLYQ